MDSSNKTLNRTKSTLISAKALKDINDIVNRNNNRILSIDSDLATINDEFYDDNSTLKRPQSALLRGVKITDLKETKINPEPIFTDHYEDFLGNYLSPYKLVGNEINVN